MPKTERHHLFYHCILHQYVFQKIKKNILIKNALKSFSFIYIKTSVKNIAGTQYRFNIFNFFFKEYRASTLS